MALSVSLLREWSRTAPLELERVIRGLLYVYIFSLLFHQLLFVERNGFIVLLGLLGVWCLSNQRLFYAGTVLDAPLLAFVLWVGSTIPFATFPAYSAKEFGKLLQQVVVFYAVVYFLRDQRHKRVVVWVLIWGLLGKSLLGICGRIWELAVESGANGNLVLAPIIQADVWLTTHLVMLLPLSLAMALTHENPAAKRFCFGVTGLATLCLILLRSQAGLLAVLCELWLAVWCTRRRRLFLVVCGFTIVLAIGVVITLQRVTIMVPGTSVPMIRVSEASREHRLDIWKFALARIGEHPIVGIGYGKETYSKLYGQAEEEVQPGRWRVRDAGAHNSFLGIALETGILGAMLFVWLLFRIGRHALRRFRGAWDGLESAMALGVARGVIGLTVRLFFDHMFVSTIGVLLMVMASLVCAATPASGGTLPAESQGR